MKMATPVSVEESCRTNCLICIAIKNYDARSVNIRYGEPVAMKERTGVFWALIPAYLLGLVLTPIAAQRQQPALPQMNLEARQTLVNQYCVGCHNDKLRSGGFSWADIDLAHPENNPAQLEKVIRKLRAGMMPPAGARRPDSAGIAAFAAAIETSIDRAAETNPYVKPPALHRLNRAEYRNSIRDLLDIDVDVSSLLPADPKVGAFDNLADALTVTPALMQGYFQAAEKISREVVGDLKMAPMLVAYSDPTEVSRTANQY